MHVRDSIQKSWTEDGLGLESIGYANYKLSMRNISVFSMHAKNNGFDGDIRYCLKYELSGDISQTFPFFLWRELPRLNLDTALH